MRQVTRKGLISVAAAGGVLAMSGGAAHADSGASGSSANSPGVISGNTVQVPIDIPVNICGNTITVIGALNPAFGNDCLNKGGRHGDDEGGSELSSGAAAEGTATNSPGVASGNTIQVPVDVPANVCGNSVSVIGVLNPATDNDCVNNGSPKQPGEPEKPTDPEPEKPEKPEKPADPEPEKPEQEEVTEEEPETGPGDGPRPDSGLTEVVDTSVTPIDAELAQTGSSSALSAALPLGMGMLVGGALLYRRGRLAHQR